MDRNLGTRAEEKERAAGLDNRSGRGSLKRDDRLGEREINRSWDDRLGEREINRSWDAEAIKEDLRW